jgi:hypothetical protein
MASDSPSTPLAMAVKEWIVDNRFENRVNATRLLHFLDTLPPDPAQGVVEYLQTLIPQLQKHVDEIPANHNEKYQYTLDWLTGALEHNGIEVGSCAKANERVKQLAELETRLRATSIIKGTIRSIGPEGEHCSLCVAWTSSGIRPFGRCEEHDDGVQDLWWCPTFKKE